MKIKLLIVDDYNIFRSGLKLILEKQINFEVVGEALNPSELFLLLENIKPDVIVLNLMLPQKHIFSITQKLSNKHPNIPFVLLSGGGDEFSILECVINGARGILWKESTTEQLVIAINTVASGEKYLFIPEYKLVNKIIEHIDNTSSDKYSFSEISAREQDVIKLFAKGYSYKRIGKELNISPRTVESHKKNILSKLDLNSVTEMIKYAIKHNLAEL